MWHECSKSRPDQPGEYYTVRRGIRGKSGVTHYNDWCKWNPPYWMNSRGVVIQTVEWWSDGKEEET